MSYVDELLSAMLVALSEARWSDARQIGDVLESFAERGVVPATADVERLTEAALSTLRTCENAPLRRELVTFLLSGAMATLWRPGGEDIRPPVAGPVERAPEPTDSDRLTRWLGRGGKGGAS